MARGKTQGLALVALTARLPWWVGTTLAGASYLGLPVVAQHALPVLAQPRPDRDALLSALCLALAGLGQQVLPFLFALGALISLVRAWRAAPSAGTARRHPMAAPAEDDREERRPRPRRGAADPPSDALAALNWREFETLVGDYFKAQGYDVVATGGGGPDGGVDVMLRQGADTYLVQCKHWRASRVGVKPVRELYGVMAAERAAGGFVVTSGDFTQEARRFAKGRELQLIDGRTLRRSMENAD